MLSTDLKVSDLLKKRTDVINEVYKNVPSGVGEGGKIKVSKDVLKDVLKNGINWAVKEGYGKKDDALRTEENGCMKSADPSKVSDKALQRGMPQLGSLGAGNHFMEIQKVDKIYDKEIAKKFGIYDEEQITLMVHCGSRGLGHQVASDYIKLMEDKYGFSNLPDRELINAPINSELGQDYYKAMSSAANFAFANKQMITHWIRESFNKIFGNVKIDVIFDLCHNIAKFEKHNIDGKIKQVCIHRKGAARSFGPGREEIPEIYRSVGQPVIIPGSMGTASYLLVGTKKAEEISFGSTCFSEDTKILTDKGILNIKDIYTQFNDGEQFLALSINEDTLKLEWKPILNSMKRKANLIEVAISQTNRSNQSKLKTTPNHRFITIDNFKLIKEEINDIIKKEKSLCLIDNIPDLFTSEVKPELAYLVGALVSDGSFYCNKRHGRVTFIQKKIPEKIDFINHVQMCFFNIFDVPLREYRERSGGGNIRGKQIFGSATDYICCQKMPATVILNIYNNLSTWVMSLNEEAICNYLAGLIDGDGTWNQKRSVLQIYTGDENVVGATLLACLKLNILPYISKQRKNCFVIQLSENEDLILRYSKRIKGQAKKRKYGQKLFSAKQLFNNLNVRWPYKHKSLRNNLMSFEQIKAHLHKYPEFNDDLYKLIKSPIRMQRVKKLREIGFSDVYNIEVKDNHNYVVLSETFMPILVKNCHGAGRLMSRNAALREFRGEKVKSDLMKKNIEIKAGGWKSIAEEAPEVYKDIDEVVNVSHKVGIGNLVCRVIPLGVMKG
ncbi:MAG: RtcB family protein [archaeon]